MKTNTEILIITVPLFITMLVSPSGASSLLANTVTTTTTPAPTNTSLAMKKSASDSNVVSSDPSCPARRSSNPVPSSGNHMVGGDGGGGGVRRSSDGDAISLTSDTDGLDPGPGSPLAFGVVDWTDTASSLAHIFVPTHSSIDHCYLHTECLHSGHR